MSLFHAVEGVVTLMFADDKWTRNEAGTTTCAGGGTAQVDHHRGVSDAAAVGRSDRAAHRPW